MAEITLSYAVRRTDDDYVVYESETSTGYNVVPKSVDPSNMYEIEDVRAWCEANPDKVMQEPEESETPEIPDDVQGYLTDKASIDADVVFLKNTDDVAYQLARHERGTETLSPEKYAECMARDAQRGQISSTLKQRRAALAATLAYLEARYNMIELRGWGIK